MKQAIIAGACIIALATLGACSNTTESSASNTPNQPVSSAAPTTESPGHTGEPDGHLERKRTRTKTATRSLESPLTPSRSTGTRPTVTPLYWAGSYIAPTDSKTPYTWDSVNDTEKTGSAILASSDETKTFTYSDDTISYSVTAAGSHQEGHLGAC